MTASPSLARDLVDWLPQSEFQQRTKRNIWGVANVIYWVVKKKKVLTWPKRYFLAEKKFSQVQVFEQRATPGGVWNYTPEHGEKQFRLPRTVPTEEPDEPIYAPGSAAPTFVSPVYDFLETNIPQTLMNYCDKPFPEGCALFPTHATVLRYLEEYAEDLSEHLVMSTQVLKVSKVGDDAGGPRCWEVETRDLRSGEVARRQFDAVLVASGHYNDPFVPDIPGLAEFEKRFPGSISHSKFYRRPDQFKDKVRASTLPPFFSSIATAFPKH